MSNEELAKRIAQAIINFKDRTQFEKDHTERILTNIILYELNLHRLNWQTSLPLPCDEPGIAY